MTPRVSFVIASFDQGHFLGQAIDSLLAQSYKELEVIVIDDHSQDDTPRLLGRYSGNPRVRMIRHDRNMGASLSRNDLFSKLRSEYVGIMDADDFAVHPEAVSRQVAVLDNHPDVGFVFTAIQVVDDHGRFMREFRRGGSDYVHSAAEEFATLVLESYVTHSGTLMRRSAQEAVGGYDLSLPYGSDWDLWLRFAARHGVGYLADVMYAYRVHRANMTHTRVTASTANASNLKVIQHAFAALPADALQSLQVLKPIARRRALLAYARGAPVYGQARLGWNGLTDAVRRCPTLFVAPELYPLLARVLLLTLVGVARYDRIASARRALQKTRVAEGLADLCSSLQGSPGHGTTLAAASPSKSTESNLPVALAAAQAPTRKGHYGPDRRLP